MKKITLFAAAVSTSACALLATTAQAQQASSVTMYGSVDAAVEHLTNAGSNGATLTRVPGLTGGSAPSRLGFRGSEDLGGGLRAVFTLEEGIAVDTGALNQGGPRVWAPGFCGAECPLGHGIVGAAIFHAVLVAARCRHPWPGHVWIRLARQLPA